MQQKAQANWPYSMIINDAKNRAERFIERIPMSGCWLWTGAVHKQHGYGRFSFMGKARNAHRVLFELYKGKPNDEMDIDHLCRVRSCVNPYHLEQVTRSINATRGLAGKRPNPKAAENAKNYFYKQTKCKNGHDRTDANIYMYRGHRLCKLCMKASASKHKQKKETR